MIRDALLILSASMCFGRVWNEGNGLLAAWVFMLWILFYRKGRDDEVAWWLAHVKVGP
jgi:hypothetical protein